MDPDAEQEVQPPDNPTAAPVGQSSRPGWRAESMKD